ncbi:unnamed protein product [Rhodiola kirilowii]
MGALANFSLLWMPEDDFRLKNAMEGGASLESLAKGAVRFSRRFTLQQIKERWVSILYDPVISTEVSASVMEIERKPSNLSRKSFKLGGSEDNQCTAKTIKTVSVRDHYYAVRKRIRYENHMSMEMDFAGEQTYASDHNNEREPLFNFTLGDPTSDQFENQQSDARLVDHCFPLVKVDGVATSCTVATAQPFHAPHEQSIPDIFLAEQGSLPEKDPLLFDAAFLPIDCFQFEKLDILENTNICASDGIAEDPLSIFDQAGDTGDLLDELNGLMADCGVSFQSLDFTLPLPELPMWDTNNDISSPMMHANDNSASQSHIAGDVLALPEGGEALPCMPDYNACPAKSPNRGGDPRTSDSDEYLTELYDLLDDDISVMNTDDKSLKDNPLYEDFNSLLLPSPVVGNGDQNNITAEPLASIPPDLPQSTTIGVNLVVSCISGASRAVECQAFPDSDFQMSSFSLPPQSHVQNDFAACILNTEVPQVPNNDDISLPPVSSSVKDLLELCNRNHADAAVDFKAPNNLAKVGTNTSLRSLSLLPNSTKGEHPEHVISRCSNHCLDNVARPLETNGLCNKSDNLLGAAPDDQALNGIVDCNGLSARETLALHPVSEFDDNVQESDDEIPYYSDVEEMVLEMDLDPVEQDIKLKEKVLKYQSNDAKKTIIRLEQAAHSYMQRAIARQGALAVIYGRNSKHYIKKFEVLLGRGTDDSHVDIDLGAEGRAQKVSRRQAVIKLEADGKFYIKNIGKRSIYKNNNEVATGQIARLESGNFIEIRRIAFIFEDSPVCVRRRLRSLHKPVKPMYPCKKSPELGLPAESTKLVHRMSTS